MEFKDPQPAKKLNMATEAELERNNQIVQRLIEEAIEERDNMIATQGEIEIEIAQVATNIELYADGEEKFRPILNSLLKTQARLNEGIVYFNTEIAEYKEYLEGAKREDAERRENLLKDFDGTKQ